MPNVHNLNIYPHSGPVSCLGCVPGAAPAAGGPAHQHHSAPVPRPRPRQRPGPTVAQAVLVRVQLEAEAMPGADGYEARCTLRVTLYGASGPASVSLRDARTDEVLRTFSPTLTEGAAKVLETTIALPGSRDLVARAEARGAQDEAFATVEPPADVELLDVQTGTPPRWTVRTGGEETNAIRRPTLLSCAEADVLFVRPDAALDPTFQVVVTGRRLSGHSVRCELRSQQGEVLAQMEVVAGDNERVELAFDQLPARLFGQARVRQVTVRVTCAGAQAERKSPLTFVRIYDVQSGDAHATQVTWDLAYTLLGLGTRERAPLRTLRVSSMRRRPAHQLSILRDYGRRFRIAGANNMQLADAGTWMPVLLAVRQRGIRIAAPRTVRWNGRTYGASAHTRGVAVDFTPYAAGTAARITAICAAHGVAVHVIPEPQNNAIHVQL